MPGRKIPIVTEEIYHVFNRGINRQPTFTSKREYLRAIEAIKFYRFTKQPLSLSKFLRLDPDKKAQFLELQKQNETEVEILCYCLMPNHFHFLLKQKKDGGISRFLSNFQNSYTRYFNTRTKRDGNLFLDQFKAVRIETDEQLIHVGRYIELNPYTSFIIKDLNDLIRFPWSSLNQYISNANSFLSLKLIKTFFRNINDYQKFIFDQADYQRRLNEIKHLTLE